MHVTCQLAVSWLPSGHNRVAHSQTGVGCSSWLRPSPQHQRRTSPLSDPFICRRTTLTENPQIPSRVVHCVSNTLFQALIIVKQTTPSRATPLSNSLASLEPVSILRVPEPATYSPGALLSYLNKLTLNHFISKCFYRQNIKCYLHDYRSSLGGAPLYNSVQTAGYV